MGVGATWFPTPGFCSVCYSLVSSFIMERQAIPLDLVRIGEKSHMLLGQAIRGVDRDGRVVT